MTRNKSGWYNERNRHRLAALKGRRSRKPAKSKPKTNKLKRIPVSKLPRGWRLKDWGKDEYTRGIIANIWYIYTKFAHDNEFIVSVRGSWHGVHKYYGKEGDLLYTVFLGTPNKVDVWDGIPSEKIKQIKVPKLNNSLEANHMALKLMRNVNRGKYE